MRDYGKVHISFWTSETTRSLNDDGKMLALYLMTSPHTNMIGVFRAPDGYISEDLDWGLQRVKKGFQNIEKSGFATRCDSSKWVVIHNHLKWNGIENPNQAKSAFKLLESVPVGIEGKSAVARVLLESCERFEDKLPDDFRKRLETLTKPFPNQEQEQEQEQYQEQEQESASADASVSRDKQFEKLWQAFGSNHGEKGSKKTAKREFEKLDPDSELFNEMLGAVCAQVQRKNEQAAANQFAPPFQHVERWIKNERWNDELPIVRNPSDPDYSEFLAEPANAAH